MSPTDTSMSSRRRSPSWLMRTIALVLLVAVATGAGVIAGAKYSSPDDATASTQLADLAEFDVVEETYDAIRSHYVLSDETTDQQLMYGASRGMVESLGDTNHSTFLDPQEADDFTRELQSELIGIGVQIDLTGPVPVVVAPIDGSPAWEAGIKPGDVIIAVDGVESAGRNPREVTDMLRGEAGTDVTLELRHRNAEETYTVTITRAQITLNPVTYMMLPDNVLWLRIARFSSGTADGVRDALLWGKRQGMTGVVLDLRNNPGGYTDEALKVGAQFMPEGSVLYKEQLADGTVVDQFVAPTGGEWTDGDIVVLIDGGSASAAEIVSSGLRDNGRAQLFGERTVGTGTVLSGFTLSDGSMALLGTKLWLTAGGTEIWKVGVEPDIEVAIGSDQFPRLPLEFDGDHMTGDQLVTSDDAQLIAAFDSIAATTPAVSTPAA